MVIIMQDGPYFDISEIHETIRDSPSGMVYSYTVAYTNKKKSHYPMVVLVEGLEKENVINVYCTTLDDKNTFDGEGVLVDNFEINNLSVPVSEYVGNSLAQLDTERQNHPDDFDTAFLNWYKKLI
ncbi:hypothetical protein GQ473_07685 [archaeon]|nr:hypothetical protein [archaeon]